MPKPYRSTEHTRAYRQRLRAAGSEEVLLQLPRATVAMLDAIKERHGCDNELWPTCADEFWPTSRCLTC